MTSKQYLLAVSVLVIGVVSAFMAFNFWQDDFGLFWSNGEKRIWVQEKTSKYLMSFRYIPEHFDGLLIGPSFSNGLMDTKRLHGYRIYNLSMDNSNATELRIAVDNAISRGRMRVVIICLSPFLTKDSGMRGPEINSKEYWGSLFSWLPLNVLNAKFKIRSGKTMDVFAGSEWGMSNNVARRVYAWDEFTRMQPDVDDEITLDPAGFDDLKRIVDASRAHGAKVFAYFYPYNYWRLEFWKKSGTWAQYRDRTLAIFDRSKDILWDMNEPMYAPLTRDAACYTDGHLSAAGARLVLAEIQRRLDQVHSAVELPPLFNGSEQLACLGKAGAGSGFDKMSQPSVARHWHQ